MYIKKSKKTDPRTEKSYFAYHLIKSVRTPQGPRQKVLLYLGADISISDEEIKMLAQRIEDIVSGYANPLLVYPETIERLAQQYASLLIRRLAKGDEKDESEIEKDFNTIDVNSIEQSEPRTVGAEHLLLQMANQLQIPEALKEAGFSKKEIALSLGTIIARAVAPASERATRSWLLQSSGLGELLKLDFEKTAVNSLYSISDMLLKNKDALEKHLEATEEKLHGCQNSIALYDLTNVYMEGQAKGNSKAAHGVSKEKRADCPLVTLGIVVNEYGFITRTKILPGNVSEPKTLQEAITALDRAESLIKPIILLDAGISSEDNLQWLRDNGYQYIVSARQKAPSLDLEGELVPVGDSLGNVKAALIKIPGSKPQEEGDMLPKEEKPASPQTEKWLYCESKAKEAVATQMKKRFQEKYEADLKKIQTSLNSLKGRKKYTQILERIGRLKEKHKQISACYDITVETAEDKQQAKSISWNTIPEKMDAKLTGYYFLRTNIMDMDPKQLWSLYNTLRGVEDVFRFMKSSLGLRPVYHSKECRVDGHLFISVLAYHLIQNCMHQLKKQEENLDWRTILARMSTRVRVTMKANMDDGRILYHRSTTQVEEHQSQIYKALNLSSQILQAVKVFV